MLSDNVDINKNNVSSWHDLISYVPSNYLLLNSSIKSNVAYGKYKKKLMKKMFLRLRECSIDNFMKLSGINLIL